MFEHFLKTLKIPDTNYNEMVINLKAKPAESLKGLEALSCVTADSIFIVLGLSLHFVSSFNRW